MNLLSPVSLLLLLHYSIITNADDGALRNLKEHEAENIHLTLPASATNQLVHGICIAGASKASAKSTALTYTSVGLFADNMKLWDDRDYKVKGTSSTPCAKGLFLRPSKHKAIAQGTVIDIDVTPRSSGSSSDVKVCVFTSDNRHGGYPTSLVDMGFIPYPSAGFGWDLDSFNTPLCKQVANDRPCREGRTHLEIILNTGNHGDQNSVSIRALTDNGWRRRKSLYKKGFKSNEMTKISHCLHPEKCYKITIKDNKGDGMSDGDGSYEIMVDGETVKSSEFNNGSKETHEINCKF